MKSLNLVKGCLSTCLTLTFLHFAQPSYSQCAAAPIAAAACIGGNGTATSGGTINSGISWVTGASNNFASLTLSGGTLRVCGNLNITTLNFNSGNLVVESGGSVTITSLGSTNLNGNVVFINRGTITMTTNMTFQNPGNAIYNDLSTSVFTVAGLVTVNNALIVNRGTMSLSGLYYQGAAGNFCMQDQSITNIGAFTNVTTNSFSYSGVGSASCLNISTSATLQDNVTSSNKLRVCKKTGVTATGGATGNPGGGWGSAVVTSGCSSCATVLALNITDFTAFRQGNAIDLQWTASQDLAENETFYVEKSLDATNFYTLTALPSSAGQDTYSVTDVSITASKLYYRLRAVSPSGASYYSPILLVQTDLAGDGKLQIYPNPVKQNTAITLFIPSSRPATARILLVSMEGKAVRSRTATLLNGSNTLIWDLQGLAAGIYIVRVDGSPDGVLYRKISVQAAN
jgi:hypothetical protein